MFGEEFSACDSTHLRDATRARVIGRKHEGRVPRQRFNSPTNFPRDGHGAGKLRARRDFCCRCPIVPARHVLRDTTVPAGPPHAVEGPHLRVRGGSGRRGADPVSFPVLHVRPHLCHLRRRRDLPPPLGLRTGRPAELGVAGGQVLDLPVPRDHVRRHAIRAQEGGGHPDMSAVVTASPSITGRSVPGAEKEVLAQLQVAFGSKLKDAKIVRERLVELVIDRADLVPLCTYLKDTIGFEHLSCVTAVDWKDHFESIYHIENYYNGCMVQVNAQIPYDDPKIATLTGLWNMKVKVDGETVTDAKPEIGYLHRGYEKIMEVREFQKNVVLTDRLCYVSSITWSHAYCLAVEKMMGIETPERGQWIRVVALELQRIASHLMWLAAYGPDLGLLTGLLWALRERELFLDLIQLMSGARMNQNYPRVGGVRNDLPDNFEAMCRRSIEHFLEKVDNEYRRVFQESKVFHMRTEGVGKISAAEAINWGVTGPNLRACGVNVDLRRLDPYEVYEEIDFEPQVWHDGGSGDSYARFVCRFNELRESCQIILQALEKMPKTGPYRVKAPRRAEGEGYAKTEDSRGEALFYVIGDGDDRPYRVKIRSPVFCTMAATPIMLRGNKLADSVAILGSVDVCVGEMDK